MPAYMRVLDQLQKEDHKIVSSAEMGRWTGFSSEQIRKDLAYFGAFGTRGVGYDVKSLQRRIRSILGLEGSVPVILVGGGSLGSALARYNRLHQPHLEIICILDNDEDVVGTTIAGIKVRHVREMQEVVRESQARLAVVAVPGDVAQKTVDALVKHGIRSILNFAPVHLQTPSDVVVKTVDLTSQLQSLAYYAQRLGERTPGQQV